VLPLPHTQAVVRYISEQETYETLTDNDQSPFHSFTIHTNAQKYA